MNYSDDGNIKTKIMDWNMQEFWNTTKRPNIWITGIDDGAETRVKGTETQVKGTENTFIKIIEKNLP